MWHTGQSSSPSLSSFDTPPPSLSDTPPSSSFNTLFLVVLACLDDVFLALLCSFCFLLASRFPLFVSLSVTYPFPVLLSFPLSHLFFSVSLCPTVSLVPRFLRVVEPLETHSSTRQSKYSFLAFWSSRGLWVRDISGCRLG